MSKLIYVVDDDKNIRELVSMYIRKEGYNVRTFENAEDVLACFNKDKPDMLIIDIMLPGIDGYELCKKVRVISDVPIIIISAKGDDIDKIVGFEIGADDYISKPFSPRELIARIKSIFKRTNAPQNTNKIKIKDILIVIDERRILHKGKEIEFTSKEFDLILYLSKNANKAYTREQLLKEVWKCDLDIKTRAVDDMIKRIRKKLQNCECEFDITTIWGYGYKVES